MKQEEFIGLLNDLIGSTMALSFFKARSCLKCEKKEYKKLIRNVSLARNKICKKVLGKTCSNMSYNEFSDMSYNEFSKKYFPNRNELKKVTAECKKMGYKWEMIR